VITSITAIRADDLGGTNFRRARKPDVFIKWIRHNRQPGRL